MAHPRILIVEDDDELRQALAGAVSALGAVAEPARNSSEALKLLGAGRPRPEAILLDMDLPRREAESLLACLRADPQLAGVPVVTVSDVAASRAARSPASPRRRPVDAPDIARILVSLCRGSLGGLPAAEPA